MRAVATALIALLVAAACTESTNTQVATPIARAANPSELVPFFGTYSTGDGRPFVIARHGWFFDVRDATYRTIYSGATPNRFTIGPAFEVPLPTFANLRFDGTMLTLATSHATVSAHRLAYKETDVRFPRTARCLP